MASLLVCGHRKRDQLRLPAYPVADLTATAEAADGQVAAEVTCCVRAPESICRVAANLDPDANPGGSSGRRSAGQLSENVQRARRTLRGTRRSGIGYWIVHDLTRRIPRPMVRQHPRRSARRARRRAGADPRGHRLFDHRGRRPQGRALRLFLDRRHDRHHRRSARHDLRRHRRDRGADGHAGARPRAANTCWPRRCWRACCRSAPGC